MKHQAAQRLVNGHIGADDADIPIAAAAAHQRHDLFRREQHFLIFRANCHRADIFLCNTLGDRALVQLLPHLLQRGRLRGNQPDLHFHPRPLGTADDLLSGIACLFKGHGGRCHPVAVKTHRHRRRILDQMLQNGKVLPGKVRKAVDIEHMLLGKVAILQLPQ